jgi:hypothetical protein
MFSLKGILQVAAMVFVVMFLLGKASEHRSYSPGDVIVTHSSDGMSWCLTVASYCPGELHQHAASAPRNNSFPQLR